MTIIALAPPPKTPARRGKLVFGGAPAHAKGPYRTPGDPPCKLSDVVLYPGGPRVPAWVDSYCQHAIESEYPDWPPSAAQRAELAARGLPEAASWWEARVRLGRARKRTTT